MNIILGVCGSISAYKSLDIMRALVNQGHNVKVVLTKGAEEFVKAQVFKYLGASEVYRSYDDFNFPAQNEFQATESVLHIALSKWASRLVICPLSANTLSALAHGQAYDLLTSISLAWPKDKAFILFPAMNSGMLNQAQTQENFKTLMKNSSTFIHPTDEGKLVCGDEGSGKLPAVEKIVESIESFWPLKADAPTALITTGATVTALDPVRYLTNSSSGLTGFYLAKEALKRGFQVHLIAGIYSSSKIDLLKYLPGITIERVKSTSDMKKAVFSKFSSCKFYISSAAIGDFEFESGHEKIKKSKLQTTLPIKLAPDILAEVIKVASDKQSVVGFAAETDLGPKALIEKWNRKPVKLLVGTKVHNGLNNEQQQQGLGTVKAYYNFVQNGEITFEGELQKQELASSIFDHLL